MNLSTKEQKGLARENAHHQTHKRRSMLINTSYTNQTFNYCWGTITQCGESEKANGNKKMKCEWMQIIIDTCWRKHHQEESELTERERRYCQNCSQTNQYLLTCMFGCWQTTDKIDIRERERVKVVIENKKPNISRGFRLWLSLSIIYLIFSSRNVIVNIFIFHLLSRVSCLPFSLFICLLTCFVFFLFLLLFYTFHWTCI